MADQPDPDRLVELMPFAVHAGVKLSSATAEEVVGTLAWAPERCTAGGLMHGGAVMTLADSCAAVCAFLNLPDGGKSTATIEANTSFMRGLRGGTVTAIAKPVRLTRTHAFLETELRDADGRLVAKVSQIQVFSYPRA
jgi:1,4-dihydroxy-2-naphthoyl-CoA hydrolase